MPNPLLAATIKYAQRTLNIGDVYLKKLEKTHPLFKPYLDAEGLEGLKRYKYSSGGYTHLDNLLNKYWWTPLAEYIPAWVHPNTLTVVALACSFFMSTLPLIYFSPDFATPCPRWVHFIVAVGMILYQTLDALDGKQARRTRLSSPIGQMMDHGCDSLTATYAIFMTCATLGIGNGPMMAGIVGAMTFQLLMYSWWEHTFGVFRACTGNWFGVTEGQLLIAIGNAICVWDPHFWSRTVGAALPLPIAGHLLSGLTLGLPIRYIAYLGSCGSIVMMSINDVRSLFTDSPPPHKHEAIKEWVQLGFHVYCCMALVIGQVISRNPFLATTALAAATSLVTWRLIITCVGKAKLRAYQWPTLPFWISAMLCSCNVLSPTLETVVQLLTAGWCTLALVVFIYVNMKLMKDHLNIPMFTVPEKNQRYALGLEEPTTDSTPTTAAGPTPASMPSSLVGHINIAPIGEDDTLSPHERDAAMKLVSEAMNEVHRVGANVPQYEAVQSACTTGPGVQRGGLTREEAAMQSPVSPEPAVYSPMEGDTGRHCAAQRSEQDEDGKTESGMTGTTASPVENPAEDH